MADAPSPKNKILNKYADNVKGMLTVEMNAGQMVEDVRLAVNGKVDVAFYGRLGGIVPTPDQVLKALKDNINLIYYLGYGNCSYLFYY